MSTLRLVSISPNGNCIAYRGKVVEAKLRVEPYDEYKAWIEYYRTNPDKVLAELDAEESTEDGVTERTRVFSFNTKTGKWSIRDESSSEVASNDEVKASCDSVYSFDFGGACKWHK